jgi:hypothetical protein
MLVAEVVIALVAGGFYRGRLAAAAPSTDVHMFLPQKSLG